MMKETTVRALVAMAVCIGSGAPAAMAASGIAQANSQMHVGYARNTDFTLTSIYEDGYNISAQDGKQQGVVLGFSQQADVGGMRNLYVSAQFTSLRGKADYNGFVADAAQVIRPYVGKDEYQYKSHDVAFKLGQGWEVGPHAQITPYVTAGYSWSSRNDEDSGGYWDEASNRFYGAGAMVQYEFAPQWVITVDGSYARNHQSQTQWVRDGAVFQHRNKHTTQWGVGVNYSPMPHLSVFAKWHWTEREFGVSARDGRGWYERPLHAKQQQVQLGVGYNF